MTPQDYLSKLQLVKVRLTRLSNYVVKYTIEAPTIINNLAQPLLPFSASPYSPNTSNEQNRVSRSQENQYKTSGPGSEAELPSFSFSVVATAQPYPMKIVRTIYTRRTDGTLAPVRRVEGITYNLKLFLFGHGDSELSDIYGKPGPYFLCGAFRI